MSYIYISMSEEKMSIDAMRHAQQLIVSGLTMAGYTVKSSEGSTSGSYRDSGEFGKLIPYKHITISIIANKE